MVHYPKEMPSKHDAIVALYSIHEFVEVAVVVAEEVAVVKKLNVRPKPSLLAMILFEHLMNIAMILQLINYNSNISMEIKMFIRFF